MRGYAKSGTVSQPSPRSRASTLRPAAVSSMPMMAPVQPKPTSTASTLGFLMFAMSCPSALRAGDADGRQRVVHAGFVDPIEIVGTSAREADHLPGRGILVAAMNRIAEV